MKRVSASPTPFTLSARFFSQTLDSALILLPHSDDECAFGGLLQHLRDPTILFLTDSAPENPLFWEHYGSRESYARLRESESNVALGLIGAHRIFSADSGCGDLARDQRLHKNLFPAIDAVHRLIRKLKPRSILSPAYEGGHPDHDSASFIAALSACEFQLQHWETPYYHRSRSGKFRAQSFLPHSQAGVEIAIELTPQELAQKRRMWSQFESQAGVLAQFAPEREIYRLAPPYDYLRPPHRGILNYEAWGWGVTGSELSHRFSRCMRSELFRQCPVRSTTTDLFLRPGLRRCHCCFLRQGICALSHGSTEERPASAWVADESWSVTLCASAHRETLVPRVPLHALPSHLHCGY